MEWDEPERCASVGYVLSEQFWGLGYATEALCDILCGIIGNLFVAYPELDRIEARHAAENAASGRVIQKAGMRRVRTEPLGVSNHTGVYDCCYYEITREVFESPKTAAPALC